MVYQSWCIQLRGKQGKVRRTLRFSYLWLCKELTGGSGRKGELRRAVRIAASCSLRGGNGTAVKEAEGRTG